VEIKVLLTVAARQVEEINYYWGSWDMVKLDEQSFLGVLC